MRLAAAVAAALACSTRAQTQFAELPRLRLPHWFTSGPGWFTDGNAIAGDLDGDGAIDLVSLVGLHGSGLVLLRNDGSGRFAGTSSFALPPGDYEDLAVGDVDGDGDLDLVIACDGQNRLLRNDGNCVFTDVTATHLPIDSDDSAAVVLGDVDGDGDLDLVIGNQQQQNRLYRNDGTGRFTDVTATQFPIDSDSTLALALGDIDGDGDLDLVVSNFRYGFGVPGQQNRLYRNDGSGLFTDVTATQLPAGGDPSNEIVLGDIDGDGDLDMIVHEIGLWFYVPSGTKYPGSWFFHDVGNRLLRNDGSGTFGQPLPGPPGDRFVFGDVDGDGDLDHLALDVAPRQNQLFLNDGTGVFTNATGSMPANAGGVFTLVDIDGDGDLDLVESDLYGNRVFVNLQRQLDAPDAPAIGQSYRVDAYVRDPSGWGGLVFPLVGFGPAAIAMGSLGTLGVDPAAAFPLPLLVVPPATGAASLSLPLPGSPEFVGLDCYLQALCVPAAGPPRLCGVVHDRVAPATVERIVNGGFEQGASGVQSVLPGWTSTSGCGMYVFAQGSSTLALPMAGSRSVATRFACGSGLLAFHQDVPTSPGSNYMLRVGYSPTIGNGDNHVHVRWNGVVVIDLQQDAVPFLGYPGSLWSVHRGVVQGAVAAANTRLEIADPGPAGNDGGLVDEVSVVALDFDVAIQVTGELVHAHPRFDPLRVLLRQAAIAAANNNLPAKAAALAAFVAAVHALPANTILPEDATLLVAIAGAL